MMIFILLSTLPSTAQLKELTEKVTVRLTGTNALEVIRELDRQSNYTFTYEQPRLAAVSIRHVQFDHVNLGEVLDWLQKEYHLSYSVRDGNISVRPGAREKTPPAAMQTDTTGGRSDRPGVLKRRIVDFETAQPLPGATVEIVAGGRGTVADEKGYYVFNDLPEGSTTLRVSYAGYQKNIFPDVRITGGRTLVFDVKMSAATATALNEVVVQSNAHRIKAVTFSTEKDLVREIRNSIGVVSGISNEQINKTADRNAAEVVKRISGVSVMDERFIVVRGMNDRYNLTYLNDNIAPSTELYSKAFAYDLLPSSIIDKILVYKSPTADLVADYAGAVVKVTTKNAMPVKHFDIGVQLAHRPGSTSSDIISYKGGKYDFLGFDDGTRKLPSFSPSYFQSNKQAAGISQADMIKGFSPTLGYGTRHSLPDAQLYANYYNNWKIGKAHLYDLSSITYSHETRYYDVYEQTGNTGAFLAAGGDQNIGGNNQIVDSRQGTEIGKINILENLSLKWNSSNSISLKNFFINEGRVLTTYSEAHNNRISGLDSVYGYPHTHTTNLSFEQRLLYFTNLSGSHAFMKDRQHLDWNLGYTYTLQNIPDQRNSIFSGKDLDLITRPEPPGLHYVANGTNINSYDAGYQGMISRLFIRLREDLYNGSLDYRYSFNPSFSVKAGTYQMYKTREVGRRIFRVNRGGLQPGEMLAPVTDPPGAGWVTGYGAVNPNLVFYREQYLNRIWNPANFQEDGSGLMLYDVTSPVDSYVASEQNNAGYIMGDANTLKGKLTFNAGLRVEYDVQKISGAREGQPGSILSISASHPLTSVLPSANISYRPGALYVVRAGYGRTINRPNFRELTPYNDFDYQNNELIYGNPDVISATIDNYDLRAELYPRSAAQNEMISVGAFYKKIPLALRCFIQ